MTGKPQAMYSNSLFGRTVFRCTLCGGLIIEDGSRLGPRTMIHTANHIIDNVDAGIDGQGWIKKPVHIERDVGVTMGVIILPGVRIGKGSLIGAGSVVTKDIPPYSIAVGNPCKVIKSRK